MLTTFLQSISHSWHKHTTIILLVWISVVIIALGLRIAPLYFESVAYTYDQGRDFAAAKDIVVNKNLVLIGPTTGMQGVYHGAIWYYFLAIAYVLFRGSLMGFYVAMVSLSLFCSYLLYRWASRNTSQETGLLSAVLMAASPYFLYTSTFASNTILMLPAMIVFLYGAFNIFRKETWVSWGVLGVGMGLLMESEFAFGIFIFPATALSFIFVKKKSIFSVSWKNILSVVIGAILALAPRIVFELKYNFLQTRTLLQFSDRRVEISPSMREIVFDRLGHMKSYVQALMYQEVHGVLWLLVVCAFVGYIIGRKLLDSYLQKMSDFLCVLFFTMFTLTLFYTKNPFYGYYFEGLVVLILVWVLIGIHALRLAKPRFASLLIILSTAAVLLSGYVHLTQEIQRGFVSEGLHMHTVAINHVIGRVKGKNYCLRIYTPPAITYTYSYLLDTQSGKRGKAYPHDRFIDSECWYFIESDENNERRDEWISKNIPDGSQTVYTHDVSPDLKILKVRYEGTSSTEGL